VDHQTSGDHVQERAHRREHHQLQAIGPSVRFATLEASIRFDFFFIIGRAEDRERQREKERHARSRAIEEFSFAIRRGDSAV